MSIKVDRMKPVRSVHSWRELIPKSNTAIAAILLVLVAGFFAITTKGLVLSGQTLGVLQTFAPEMLLMTIAMGFVLLIGEIDLSVGSIYVVSSVFLGATYRAGLPLWLAGLLTLLVGLGLGLINGLLVVYTRVVSFIVTLGTMWAFRGLMLVILGGGTIAVYPDKGETWLFDLLAGGIGPIKAQVFWLLVVAAVLMLVRHKTRLGLWMQAVGSNARAAKMMGVPVNRVRIKVFALSGLLCSFAGIVQVAHSNQAVPQSGDSVMLTALAGAIVGGVVLTGGKGEVLGPLLGGLTLRVISIGLVMMGVIEYWTNVMTAAAIVLTAFAFYKLDSLRTRKVQKP